MTIIINKTLVFVSISETWKKQLLYRELNYKILTGDCVEDSIEERAWRVVDKFIFPSVKQALKTVLRNIIIRWIYSTVSGTF